jgi:hypothetical protein
MTHLQPQCEGDDCCGNGEGNGNGCYVWFDVNPCSIRWRLGGRDSKNIPRTTPFAVRLLIDNVVTETTYGASEGFYSVPDGDPSVTYRLEMCCSDPGPYGECAWELLWQGTIEGVCYLGCGVQLVYSKTPPNSDCESPGSMIIAGGGSAQLGLGCNDLSLAINGVTPTNATSFICSGGGLNLRMCISGTVSFPLPSTESGATVAISDNCGNTKVCSIPIPCPATKTHLRVSMSGFSYYNFFDSQDPEAYLQTSSLSIYVPSPGTCFSSINWCTDACGPGPSHNPLLGWVAMQAECDAALPDWVCIQTFRIYSSDGIVQQVRTITLVGGQAKLRTIGPISSSFACLAVPHVIELIVLNSVFRVDDVYTLVSGTGGPGWPPPNTSVTNPGGTFGIAGSGQQTLVCGEVRSSPIVVGGYQYNPGGTVSGVGELELVTL